MGVTLTTKELAALKAIKDSHYRSAWDRDGVVDVPVWTWSANPWDGTAEATSFGGVMASLGKKGLAESYEEGEDSTVLMTAAGWDALEAADNA